MPSTTPGLAKNAQHSAIVPHENDSKARSDSAKQQTHLDHRERVVQAREAAVSTREKIVAKREAAVTKREATVLATQLQGANKKLDALGSFMDTIEQSELQRKLADIVWPPGYEPEAPSDAAEDPERHTLAPLAEFDSDDQEPLAQYPIPKPTEPEPGTMPEFALPRRLGGD